MSIELDDAAALVTGAASGIGLASARFLAMAGARVAAVDRNAETLRESTAELVAEGLDVTAFTADVGVRDDVVNLIDDVENRLGPIGYLVSAAGVLHMGATTELPARDARATLTVNAEGVLYVTQETARRMAPRRRGSIVTVASNAAETPRVGMGVYGASKAAAAMITKSIGLEVARYGVRCNVVAPGSTDTPMLRAMWQDDDAERRTITGDHETHKLGIPLGQIARPENIADAILFLLSDRASHIVLQTLTVDGGASLGR